MSRNQLGLVGLLGLPLVLLSLGCGQGDDSLVRVSGIITYQGKPLQGFVVTFQPTEGRPSVSGIDESGHFDLAYTFREKGVLKGKHKVYLHYSPEDSQVALNADRGKIDNDVRKILQKYGSREDTPLEVEITEADKNLRLDLE